MDYKFKYNPQALDLWKLSIYGIYSSMMAVVNIIFVVAMIILINKFWTSSNIIIKIVLLFGFSLFTIIQPLTIYRRAKKQVSIIPEDMSLGFNKSGIHIKMEGIKSHVKWKDVKGIRFMKNIVIIYTSNNQGYILTDNILGDEKENFIKYLKGKLKIK